MFPFHTSIFAFLLSFINSFTKDLVTFLFLLYIFLFSFNFASLPQTNFPNIPFFTQVDFIVLLFVFFVSCRCNENIFVVQVKGCDNTLFQSVKS